MENFLKTREGLEHLLKVSSPNDPVDVAIDNAIDGYYTSIIVEQNGGWL
jgi:hypothetical protein